MLKAFTFRGGIHPDDCKKSTKDNKIIEISPSKMMVYPVVQHIGAPCVPIVKVGDDVLKGQKIADSDAFVSAPIHSSVSGKVAAIEKRRHPNGNMVESIVVENDNLYRLSPDRQAYKGRKAQTHTRGRNCGSRRCGFSDAHQA